MSCLSYNSPVGPLTIFTEDDAIVALEWGWPPIPPDDNDAFLDRIRDQLDGYFAGNGQDFDLPCHPAGTAFQKSVWRIMSAIPLGQTRTYGDVAAELGSSPRAVGSACGRNPIPIIIPCHRILSANGGLGGYSGIDGIETKQFLLALEGAR